MSPSAAAACAQRGNTCARQITLLVLILSTSLLNSDITANHELCLPVFVFVYSSSFVIETGNNCFATFQKLTKYMFCPNG